MATSRRVGNYASSAKAVVRSSDQIFDAAISGRPDFTAISKEAIKGRSLERRTAMEAEGQVAKAGIQAVAKVKGYKIAADAKKDVADIKKPAQRMAGVVGALGTLGGAAVLAKGAKEDKKAAAERDAKFEDYIQRVESAYENGSGFEPTPLPAPVQFETPDLLPVPAVGGGTQAGTSVSGTDGTPRSLSSGGQRITQSQMTELLVSEGMPRADAIIGGAIGMAESGGQSDARSHPDLEARTGEMSVGLWQHNKNTGEDRHGFYGIQDWGELNDPQTNARATFRLWQRRGGWGDWGAYTNGSYSKFLPK